jgi:hypothetical protein
MKPLDDLAAKVMRNEGKRHPTRDGSAVRQFWANMTPERRAEMSAALSRGQHNRRDVERLIQVQALSAQVQKVERLRREFRKSLYERTAK